MSYAVCKILNAYIVQLKSNDRRQKNEYVTKHFARVKSECLYYIILFPVSQNTFAQLPTYNHGI